jgi:hypothetical protein
VTLLTKPLLMEMTFHFIRRLQCDSNEKVVRTIMQDLDKLCPAQDEAINQVKFTEFTRNVLRHIEHELKEKLNRLNQKSGGMFGAVDDRQSGGLPGGVVPPTITSDPTVGRPDFPGSAGEPHRWLSSGGRYPTNDAHVALGRPGHGPEAIPAAQQPLQPSMPTRPVLPQERPPRQSIQAVNAEAPVMPPPVVQAPPEPEKRKFVADLLPSTGNLRRDEQDLQQMRAPAPPVVRPQQMQRPQQLQSQQLQSRQLQQQPQELQPPHMQNRRDMDMTFDPNNRNRAQQEATHAEDALTSVDGKLRSNPAVEYEERQLEAMKREILSGNLRVQVYNQHFQPEVKRLALHGKMGLIAIFGNDGKAVASFEIRDLQCVTRGIAKTIMDPPPDPTITSALRFKDRFLCVEFDTEVTCHYALRAFSLLCGVPIYDASDPGVEPPHSQMGAGIA